MMASIHKVERIGVLLWDVNDVAHVLIILYKLCISQKVKVVSEGIYVARSFRIEDQNLMNHLDSVQHLPDWIKRSDYE